MADGEGNPNQTIFDQTVRHRIALERYSTDASKQTLSFLEDLKTDLAQRIVQATPGRRRQLEGLLEDVQELHGAVYQKITRALSTNFRALASREADWQAEKYRAAGIEATFNRVTADAAYAAATRRPMEGALLSDWMRDLEPRARDRLERQIRIAWTEGESLDAVLRRTRDVVDLNGRASKALIRTANAHISAAVQEASFEANADLIKEVEWRSVLDSRTTPICRSRDGERYPLGQGPRPPAHVSCRSIVVEILDGFPPPARETYSEWIKRQSAETQDEILGPARGKLLRSGKFNVDSFVDARGKPLTLAELNAKKAAAAKPKPKPRPPPPPPPPPPKPRTVGQGSDIVTIAPIHGMSRAQQMRRTLVKGIEVYEPASATYQRSRITQSALNDIATGKIPSGLVYTSEKIVISRDRNRHDPYWARKYKKPKFRSEATGGDKNIVIYGQKNVTGNLTGSTVAHEMGHNLQLRLHGSGNNPGPEYKALYDEAVSNPRAEQPVREYGLAAATEDFSTAVEFYVYDPARLKAQHPKRFALIDEMVKKSEGMGPLGRKGTDWSND